MARTIKAVDKQAGSPPDYDSLRQFALRHLARHSTTQARMARVLHRRIQKWASAAETEGRDAGAEIGAAQAAVGRVVQAVVDMGLINDTAYAEARSARMTLAGRSRRATSAALAARGVASGVTQAALSRLGGELPSALEFVRRRRLGPFRQGEGGADARRKELGALARAGFARDVAEQALDASLENAMEAIEALKRRPFDR